MDWLDLLVVQGTRKSLLQHHSSKASILRRSAFFIVQLSHPYMTTGKAIALTRRTFVDKVMSLLLNMLSLYFSHFFFKISHSKNICTSLMWQTHLLGTSVALAPRVSWQGKAESSLQDYPVRAQASTNTIAKWYVQPELDRNTVSDLGFFGFPVVKNWYAFRNCTSSFEFDFFLGSWCTEWLPQDAEQVQWVAGPSQPHHRKGRQPSCFSLSGQYLTNYVQYFTLYYKIGFVLHCPTVS